SKILLSESFVPFVHFVVRRFLLVDLRLYARPGGAAAALIFFAAAARAGVVSSGVPARALRVRGTHDLHQLFCRLAGFYQLGEFLEVRLTVSEKTLETRA